MQFAIRNKQAKKSGKILAGVKGERDFVPEPLAFGDICNMRRLIYLLLLVNLAKALAIAEETNIPNSANTSSNAFSYAWTGSSFASAPQFQDGDRVCFIGDSITDIGYYHCYLQLFYATRFPERKILYFTAGHSGGKAADCLARLDWDIFPKQPNIATINFGMNDMSGRYDVPEALPAEVDKRISDRMQAVQDSYEKLIKAMTNAGVKLVLIGPSIYDDTVEIDNVPVKRSNRSLILWTQRIKELAERYETGFVDLSSDMNRVNALLQKVDPKETIVSRTDRIHPGEPGNLVMLFSILKAQGIGPYVAKISVDANTGRPVDLINCSVQKVERLENGISFSCQEKALPFPTPHRTENALQWVPFTEELNREMLVVSNLSAGKYRLQIDSEVVGEYDAAELSKGVNLALNSKTPQNLQSQKVLELNDQRHKLERQLRYLPFLRHSRSSLRNFNWSDPVVVEEYLRKEIEKLEPGDYFRYVAEAYLKNVLRKSDTLEQQVNDLKNRIETARVPNTHNFTLIRLK